MEPRSKHRVFVVDNEQLIAWSLAEILNNKGFDAIPFSKPTHFGYRDAAHVRHGVGASSTGTAS